MGNRHGNKKDAGTPKAEKKRGKESPKVSRGKDKKKRAGSRQQVSELDTDLEESSHVTGGDSESCVFHSAENVCFSPYLDSSTHSEQERAAAVWSASAPYVLSSKDFQDGFSLEACLPPELARRETYSDTSSMTWSRYSNNNASFNSGSAATQASSEHMPTLRESPRAVGKVRDRTLTPNTSLPGKAETLMYPQSPVSSSFKSTELSDHHGTVSSPTSGPHHPHFYNHQNRRYQLTNIAALLKPSSPQPQRRIIIPKGAAPVVKQMSLDAAPCTPSSSRRAGNFLALFRSGSRQSRDRSTEESATSESTDCDTLKRHNSTPTDGENKSRSRPIWKTWERSKSAKSKKQNKTSIFGTSRKTDQKSDGVANERFNLSNEQNTENLAYVTAIDKQDLDFSVKTRVAPVVSEANTGVELGSVLQKGVKTATINQRPPMTSQSNKLQRDSNSPQQTTSAAFCIMKLEELERSIEKTIRDKFPDAEPFLLRRRSKEEQKGSRSLPTTPSLKKKLFTSKDSNPAGGRMLADQVYHETFEEPPPTWARSPVIVRRLGAGTRHASISPKIPRVRTAALFNSPSEISSGGSCVVTFNSQPGPSSESRTPEPWNKPFSLAQKSVSKYDNVMDDTDEVTGHCQVVASLDVQPQGAPGIEDLVKTSVSSKPPNDCHKHIITPGFSAVFGSVSPKLRRHLQVKFTENTDLISPHEAREATERSKTQPETSTTQNTTRLDNVSRGERSGLTCSNPPLVNKVRRERSRQETSLSQVAVSTTPQPVCSTSINRALLESASSGGEKVHTTAEHVPSPAHLHATGNFSTSAQETRKTQLRCAENIVVAYPADFIGSKITPQPSGAVVAGKTDTHSTDCLEFESCDPNIRRPSPSSSSTSASLFHTSPVEYTQRQLHISDTKETPYSISEAQRSSQCRGSQRPRVLSPVVESRQLTLQCAAPSLSADRLSPVYNQHVSSPSSPTSTLTLHASSISLDTADLTDVRVNQDLPANQTNDTRSTALSDTSNTRHLNVPDSTFQIFSELGRLSSSESTYLDSASQAVPGFSTVTLYQPRDRNEDSSPSHPISDLSAKLYQPQDQLFEEPSSTSLGEYCKSGPTDNFSVLKQPVSEVISQLINLSRQESLREDSRGRQRRHHHEQVSVSVVESHKVNPEPTSKVGLATASHASSLVVGTLSAQGSDTSGDEVSKWQCREIQTDSFTTADKGVDSNGLSELHDGDTIKFPSPLTIKTIDKETMEAVKPAEESGGQREPANVPPPSPSALERLMEELEEEEGDEDILEEAGDSLEAVNREMNQFSEKVYKRLSDLLSHQIREEVSPESDIVLREEICLESHLAPADLSESDEQFESDRESFSKLLETGQQKGVCLGDKLDTTPAAPLDDKVSHMLRILTVETSSSLTTSTSSESDMDDDHVMFQSFPNAEENNDDCFMTNEDITRRETLDSAGNLEDQQSSRLLGVGESRHREDANEDLREDTIKYVRGDARDYPGGDARVYHSDDDVVTGRGLPDYYDDRPLWSRRQKPLSKMSATMMALRWRERRERWLKKRRRNRTELLSTGSSDTGSEACRSQDFLELCGNSKDVANLPGPQGTNGADALGSGILTSPKYSKPILPFFDNSESKKLPEKILEISGSDSCTSRHKNRSGAESRSQRSHIKASQDKVQGRQGGVCCSQDAGHAKDSQHKLFSPDKRDSPAPSIEDTFQELMSVQNILIGMQESKPVADEDGDKKSFLTLTTENVRSVREYYRDTYVSTSGRRSRMSIADRTESDLDLYSEQRDGASSDSEVYADDEGDDEGLDPYATADDETSQGSRAGNASFRNSTRSADSRREEDDESDPSVVVSCTFYNSKTHPLSVSDTTSDVRALAVPKSSPKPAPRSPSLTTRTIPLARTVVSSDEEFWSGGGVPESDLQPRTEVTTSEALSPTFRNAREQMQDIQYHLQALRRQMEDM